MLNGPLEGEGSVTSNESEPYTPDQSEESVHRSVVRTLLVVGYRVGGEGRVRLMSILVSSVLVREGGLRDRRFCSHMLLASFPVVMPVYGL